MSGSSSGIGATPVGYGLAAVLLAAEQTAKQRETTLTEQSADGLISDSYAGLGGASTTSSISLQAEISQQTVWQNNITSADGTMQVTQTALTQITSIASSFYSAIPALGDGASIGTGQIATIAASARQALQQVASLLDTRVGNNYIFAGADSSNPPVPDPDDIMSSGFTTQISAAVGQLATNGASATIASTLAIAGSNASGTSPFSAALSQSAAVLQSQRTTVTVGDGQQITYGLVASANAEVTSAGSSTTGSYMRDLMRALATIGSLTDAQATGASGAFGALIEDTRSSLDGAITAMTDESGILGETQSAMDAQGTVISDNQTSLQTQLTGVQDVDLASTATQLSLAQTQLQASYQMISNAAKMSLVSYL